MNNCEKLLRAFIEAQSYEVEDIFNNEPDKNMIVEGWKPVPDDYKVTKKIHSSEKWIVKCHTGDGKDHISPIYGDITFVTNKKD